MRARRSICSWRNGRHHLHVVNHGVSITLTATVTLAAEPSRKKDQTQESNLMEIRLACIRMNKMMSWRTFKCADDSLCTPWLSLTFVDIDPVLLVIRLLRLVVQKGCLSVTLANTCHSVRREDYRGHCCARSPSSYSYFLDVWTAIEKSSAIFEVSSVVFQKRILLCITSIIAITDF